MIVYVYILNTHKKKVFISYNVSTCISSTSSFIQTAMFAIAAVIRVVCLAVVHSSMFLSMRLEWDTTQSDVEPYNYDNDYLAGATTHLRVIII